MIDYSGQSPHPIATCDLPLLREEFCLPELILHSDLRRRAASRRALSRPSSCLLGSHVLPVTCYLPPGAYSSELITPEGKRISERLKRLWNDKTMAYKVYVRP